MRRSAKIVAVVLATILLFTLVQESLGKAVVGGAESRSGLRVAVWGTGRGGSTAFPGLVLVLSICLYHISPTSLPLFSAENAQTQKCC